jgi:hypothetical protein
MRRVLTDAGALQPCVQVFSDGGSAIRLELVERAAFQK